MSDDEAADSTKKYGSVSKNMYGTELYKTKKIGLLGFIITVPLALYLLSIGLLQLKSSTILLAIFPWLGVVLSATLYFSQDQIIQFASGRPSNSSPSNKNKASTKAVCRECHVEIPKGAKRCPNCGWKPKERGGLWWGTTALMSLNPIGWAMGAKGASDKVKASKGVSKEVPDPKPNDSRDEEETNSESDVEISTRDPTETLKRLNELKEEGVITESEFEEKKDELLDRI
jgi:uncharacterized membrane protein/ribosomal protein L40E